MRSGSQKNVLLQLAGMVTLLFVFVTFVGCTNTAGRTSNLDSDRLFVPSDVLADDAGIKTLQAQDILTLPAGTVVPERAIDRAVLPGYFLSVAIPNEVFERINGKSFVENPTISRDELRYLKLLHYNFDHEIQVGELIVNAELDSEFLEIFLELFTKEYEIQSVYLVDMYWAGDPIATDYASIDENNTSAFNYRTISPGGSLSRHAFGKAIDINPRQNPYVTYYNGIPHWEDVNADAYIDRSSGLDHLIDHDDDCYQAFIQRGYTWGGDWSLTLDYQHFEK